MIPSWFVQRPPFLILCASAAFGMALRAIFRSGFWFGVSAAMSACFLWAYLDRKNGSDQHSSGVQGS